MVLLFQVLSQEECRQPGPQHRPQWCLSHVSGPEWTHHTGEWAVTWSRARGLSMAQWQTSLFSSHNSFSDLYRDSLDWPRGGNLYIGPNRSSAATSYTKTPGRPRMSRCHLYSVLFELRRTMQPLTFKYILKVQFLKLFSTPIHPLPTTNQNQSGREVRHILVWKWKHFPPFPGNKPIFLHVRRAKRLKFFSSNKKVWK